MPLRPALLLAALIISAPSYASETPLATVNGKPINPSDLNRYLITHPQTDDSSEQREAIMSELIARELILQDAASKNMANRRDIAAQLEEARQKVLIAASLQAWLNSNPINDAALRGEYDRQVAQLPKLEYKARHILVESETEANQLLDQLKQGGNFAQLASQHTRDPGGKNGGELGWFRAEQMVTPFADAVRALAPGQLSPQAVKSQFGWHLILLEETRPLPPPTFNQVRDQLQQILEQREIARYIESLRSKATIKIAP
jgi:peptidyl-prolyl cis-trans isomerase C